MEGDLSFALGWLFGLCFVLFALAFSGPLTYRLAKRSNFFRRVRRQRLMDEYARFLWMVNSSSFEDYLKIRGEAYLSEDIPTKNLPLSDVSTKNLLIQCRRRWARFRRRLRGKRR